MSEADWTFSFEQPLHEVFPDVLEAWSGFMARVDSLSAPDRKTHELIRMACTVILRNAPGVERHAMLAREVGATWEEIVGAIVLTIPGFGFLPAVQALPAARAGFDAAPETEDE
jgi:alkylhydroperoxidase/carboxymuconolactone decarboxylase family protein YurZ